MFDVAELWYPKQARLNEIIKKQGFFDEAMGLALELHSFAHVSEASGAEKPTLADELFENVSDRGFREISCNKNRTFAYNIWHTTRIEDVCANILIEEDVQIINTNDWAEKMNCMVTNTGNSLNTAEIFAFSAKIDREALMGYRTAVGKKTQKILKGLQPLDLKRKMKPESLRRIFDEGAVSQHPDAAWLVDYWGKKMIAGLITMPFTRHQIVHLNDCIKIKNKSLK